MRKLLTVLVSTGLLIASFQAQAVTQCTKGVIRNNYAIVYSGANASCWYFAGTGVVKFVSSIVTVTVTESCDGVSGTFSGTGTFSVKKNCTGTAAIDFGSFFGNYAFTIAEGGNSIVFMVTTPGTTGAGSGRKI